MMKQIWRVVLADDEAHIRSALRLLLEQEPGIQVVDEIAESRVLRQRVKTHLPDLLLLDWELPESGGAGLIYDAHMIAPELRVIVLSSRPENRTSALAAGAHAFVSKGDPPDVLLATIRRVQYAEQHECFHVASSAPPRKE